MSLVQVAYLRQTGSDGNARHQPLLACDILSQAIRKCNLRSYQQADLYNVIESYMLMCASNERICRTPIPIPYSR